MKKRLNICLFFLLAFVCVGFWGCSDKVEFKWSEDRGTPLIAGFIDDSLVVVYDCREWLETTETWFIGDGYREKSSCGHDRLMVFNYRVREDGPRWSDSLMNKSGGYRWYQLTDSIFWRWDENDILLWKIGETAHKMEISRTNEGCSQPSKIERMRQWLDGVFVALGNNLSTGGDSCQYAVLDTMAKTIIYKRLAKDLEWIQKCDDVRAWGDDVTCLKKHNAESIIFFINNRKLHSIFVETVPFWDSTTISLAQLSFYGNLFYCGYINSIDSEKWKMKLNPNVRPLSFPNVGEFINEMKTVISY